jgi:hypothetical protein
MPTLSYPYRPKLRLALFVTLVIAAVAYGLAILATTNDRGLILFYVIRLSPNGASMFYWALAWVSVLFLFGGLWLLYFSMFSPRRVVLSTSELSAPSTNLSARSIVIPLKSIHTISLHTLHRKYTYLNVGSPGGTLRISKDFLPSNAAFQELCSALTDRVQSCRSG